MIDPVEDGMAADAQSVETALSNVLSSKEFSGTDRLQDFLKYVVSEDLAGRADALRAKTIAVDVYRRSAGQTDAENLVRVDAGRLRRRLEIYYAGSGAADPLRIHIDRGGYVPRYEFQEGLTPTPSRPDKVNTPRPTLGWRDFPLGMKLAVLSALLSVPLSGGMLYLASKPRERAYLPAPSLQTPPSQTDLMIRREVLLNEAPERLQAMNLVEQGLNMLLPAPDAVRTRAGLIMFERAALLDQTYAGAPAASAIANGLRAALLPPDVAQRAALANTEALSAAALSLDATDPISLTARAFYDFLTQDYAMAKDRLERAQRIDPGNKHVKEYYAIFSLFAGDFETTLAVSAPEGDGIGEHERGALRNARATALLLLGRQDEAIEVLVRAAALGDPISVINHSVLAASYQADGQPRKAKQTIKQIQRAWPESNIDSLFRRLFYDASHADVINMYLDEIDREEFLKN